MIHWTFFVVSLSFFVLSSNGAEIASIPIQLHSNGKANIVRFEFDISEARLEFGVANFCEEYQIGKNECIKLFDAAFDLQLKKKTEMLQTKAQEAINREQILEERHAPNNHMLRHPLTIQSEVDNFFLTGDTIDPTTNQIFYEAEERIVEYVKQEINAIDSSSLVVNPRLCVIHSTTLSEHQDHSILRDLLTQVAAHDLSDSLQKIFVFNYGFNIHNDFIKEFSQVTFVQVYEVISFFEVPTLRILHAISKHLVERDLANTQILYMHTKGVSYAEKYQNIEDWRNLMLYFLVERHVSCYHLLASEQYDVIGVNYHDRQFAGNFWWTTGSYASTLSTLTLEKNTKYDAEKWIFWTERRFSSRKGTNVRPRTRFFIAHASEANHNVDAYPRYCYVESEMPTDNSLDTRENFQNMCRYELPVVASIPAREGEEEFSISESNRRGVDYGSKRSSAQCLSFELLSRN